MVVNQCFRFEEMSVTLMGEKSKLCKFYKIMGYLYGEAFYSQEKFTNGLKMGLSGRLWAELMEWKHSDSSIKFKIRAQQLCKESHIASLLGH